MHTTWVNHAQVMASLFTTDNNKVVVVKQVHGMPTCFTDGAWVI